MLCYVSYVRIYRQHVSPTPERLAASTTFFAATYESWGVSQRRLRRSKTVEWQLTTAVASSQLQFYPPSSLLTGCHVVHVVQVCATETYRR